MTCVSDVRWAKTGRGGLAVSVNKGRQHGGVFGELQSVEGTVMVRAE